MVQGVDFGMTCEEDFQTCGSVTFGVLGYYYLQNDYKELETAFSMTKMG